MHNPGFLEQWRPTVSRGEILEQATRPGSSVFTRAAVTLGLMLAPVLAIATVCAAFLVIAKLV